jgi:hypothetical protein
MRGNRLRLQSTHLKQLPYSDYLFVNGNFGRYCDSSFTVGLPYLITYLLTYLLTQSLTPLSRVLLEKLTRFAAGQEILCILWNPNVHHRIHNSQPTVHILRQLDPVHTPTSHFLKIYLNIIHLSKPGCSNWTLSFRVSHQNPLHISPLPHTGYMNNPSYSSRQIFGEEYRSFSSTLFRFLHSLLPRPS